MQSDSSRKRLVLAVTGHRRIRNTEKVDLDVRVALAALSTNRNVLPQDLVVASLMAPGTDMLVTRIAVARGGGAVAVLPLALEPYRESLSERDAAALDATLELCDAVELPQRSLPEPECYRDAGIRMLQMSEVLLAVWDGAPARGVGGTAEIVALAMEMGMPVMRVEAQT